MNYYLIVGNNKKGTIIDFSKLKEYCKLNSNKLKDIVAFTNSFTSETELTMYLKYHGIIPKEENNLTYGIYKKDKAEDKLEKLRFGISFKSDEKYFNVDKLSNYIIGNLANTKFFTAFINRYCSIYEAKKDKLYPTDALNAMPSIYSRYIYYINHNRFLIETMEIMDDFIKKFTKDYANLRDLAMFVVDYRRKIHHVKSNLEVIKELKEELHHLKELLNSEEITEEQRIAYTEKMKIIESDIEMRYGR